MSDRTGGDLGRAAVLEWSTGPRRRPKDATPASSRTSTMTAAVTRWWPTRTPPWTARSGRPGDRAVRRRRRPDRRGRPGHDQPGHGVIGGIPEANDRFGSALAVADIDCDGFTDLVVGTPYEDINGQADSGYVQIIWGSAAGLGKARARASSPSRTSATPSSRAISSAMPLTRWRTSARAAPRPPDAYAVAIGAPGTNVGGDNDAGWVGFLRRLGRRQRFDRGRPGHPGDPWCGGGRVTGSAPRSPSTTWWVRWHR